jgi:propionate CoA-transferase
MHREAAAHRPGVLTRVGLRTFVDPAQGGGRMNAFTTEPLVEKITVDGREWLYYRAIPVDVAIIRGTTADELGNISMEQEGAYLGVLDQALAAHNSGGIVIAQVRRLAAAESIPPKQVHVPGVLVDYVVVVPDQMQTTQTPYDPAISGEIRRPLASIPTVEWGPDKVIARRASLELMQGDVVNLGFGISALVPHVLLEEGLHNAVTWVIEHGSVGGLPSLGFRFGSAENSQSLVTAPDQFTYFHGGGFDRTLLSFMEVDRFGNVNVSRLAAKPHVTAGAGGFIDISASARRLVFSGYFTASGLAVELHDGALRIVRDGQVAKFVPKVEQITFSGPLALEEQRSVTYVTERCVLRLMPEGLTVVEIAPGVDLERDVLGRAAFPLSISPNLRPMDSRLFRPEPMGLQLPAGRGRDR